MKATSAPKRICPFCHQGVFRGGVDVVHRRTGVTRKAHKKCAERNIDYTKMHTYRWK